MSLSFTISAFIAGLVTFLAPCTLPLVPGYLAFISGVSLREVDGSATAQRTRRKVFLNGVYFIVGFSFVFIVFGALAGFIGFALAPFRIWLTRIGGLFVIMFGLFMLNVLKIPFLNREARFHVPSFFERGRPLNSLILGGAFALGWTPCVGPILGTILLLASTSVSVVSGIFLLAVFSAGLAVPFLIIAASVGSASRYIARMQGVLSIISIIGGVFLVILGFLLVMGSWGAPASFGYKSLIPLRSEFLLKYL